MNRIDRSMKTHRGGAMLVVLLLGTVITIAGVYTLRTVLYQAQAADHSYRYQQALAVAEGAWKRPCGSSIIPIATPAGAAGRPPKTAIAPPNRSPAPTAPPPDSSKSSSMTRKRLPR